MPIVTVATKPPDSYYFHIVSKRRHYKMGGENLVAGSGTNERFSSGGKLEYTHISLFSGTFGGNL
jgi:hypothetical protein